MRAAVLVTTDEPSTHRQKRRTYRSVYNTPGAPTCPDHKVVMAVYCTEQIGNGMVRRYHKCPFCQETSKSILRPETEDPEVSKQQLLFGDAEPE